MAKIAIHLVTWNGGKYIPFLFDSLRKQTFQDWKLYIVDNGSVDETVSVLRDECGKLSRPYELFENKENIGFAKGHNQLYQKNNHEQFIVIINQDIYLESKCLERLFYFLESNNEVAVASPRIMKWQFGEKDAFSNRIDSLGLKIFKNRRVVDWYAGENWSQVRISPPQNDVNAIEVFGVSGAFAMFRKNALDNTVEKPGELFDSQFWSYKEDVDLAFSLQESGYKSYVILDAVVYHDRTAAGQRSPSDWAAHKNKQTQSEWVRYYSYRNHLLALYKHEYWQNLILDFSWIFWYELKKFGYFLLFNRAVLKGLKDLLSKRKSLKKQRAHIQTRKKITWKQMRRWWI